MLPKKLLYTIIPLLILLMIPSACSQTASSASELPPSSAEWTYSFTDSTGAEITLTKRPETVAVLFSSYAEIWSLAGGTVSVTVGESIERGFVSENTPLVDDGAGKLIDHELLLAAQPDFIIGSADIEAQADACRILSSAGIPAALFRVDTFEDYLSMLKICTDITGRTDAYEKHGTTVKSKIEQLMAAVSTHSESGEKKILFIRAGSQYSATKAKRAPENFVCTMLDELGAHNIADDAAVLLDGLSLEEILLQDPDYIFLTTMGSEEAAKSYISGLFAQNGWNHLTAVRNKQYTFLSKDLFHFKPNAHWAEAYAILASHLYPELNLYG